tara:strand:- start:17047 stop:17949 length:903 start_codon:yes stop_codon:yes gene_type:complete
MNPLFEEEMINQPIGWIGLGVMGEPMAHHLLTAGCKLNIFTRTREKGKRLEDRGAVWRDSPESVGRESNLVFTMLGYPSEVESVLLGSRGVVEGIRSGSVVVDMTTSSPKLAQEAANEMKKKEVLFLDSPVSGGDIGAKNASLAIMCGGEKTGFERIFPVLQKLGSSIEWFGPSGAGQRVKMANQILIASTMIGTIESLLYAERSNLDLTRVINLIGQGAAGCWSLNQLGPRIVSKDWSAGFYIKHFIKDIEIALEDSRRIGLNLEGLKLAHRFYLLAKEKDYQNEGTQALAKVLKELNS